MYGVARLTACLATSCQNGKKVQIGSLYLWQCYACVYAASLPGHLFGLFLYSLFVNAPSCSHITACFSCTSHCCQHQCLKRAHSDNVLELWAGVCSARQQAQQEGGSLLISLASCLLECVYSLIDYLTKFATVRMAITGEAFLEAARRATDLLARNFLKVCLTMSLPFLSLAACCRCWLCCCWLFFSWFSIV